MTQCLNEVYTDRLTNMLIKRLSLKGYKPLLVNNINSFEIDLTSMYQIIIGTNGSGKSSVMREISPLPATPSNYIKGGLKQIELEFRGKDYVLTSDFTSGSKHSFICKDTQEELNPGNTATVQKELVQQLFQINPELFDILNGSITFSTMNANKRREWFVNLSGSDLDYAIRIYNRIKSAHRDTQGAIKHLNNRIVTETEKLIDPSAIGELKKSSEILGKELNVVMQNKTLIGISKDSVFRNIESQLSKIFNITESVKSIDLSFLQQSGFDKAETIALRIDECKQQCAYEESRTHTRKEELVHLNEIMSVLSSSDVHDIGELVDLTNLLSTEIEELKPQIVRWTLKGSVESTLSQSHQCLDALTDVIGSIPSNDGRYTKTIRAETEAKLQQSLLKRDKTNAYLERIGHRIAHIKESKDVNCPNCDYIWKPGISEHELADLENKSSSFQVHITELEEEIRYAREYIEKFDDYAAATRRFRFLMDSYPLMKPLWDVIVSEKIIYTTPEIAISLYRQWVNDLDINQAIFERVSKIAQYQAAIEHAKAIGPSESSHLSQRFELLNQQIEDSTVIILNLKQTIQQLQDYHSRLNSYLNKHQVLLNEWGSLKKLVTDYGSAFKDELLDGLIVEHQIKLSRISNDLMSAKIANDLVESLSKDRDQLELELSAYGTLISEISPTDGLIAEQIQEFINTIVEQMNSVIGAIWTYDMEIRPCGLENGELDYRFPLVVKNNDMVVPDVSKGSSSQVDVVDFAFKLVVMAYMELQDYPLYLDELAPTLDEQHRLNIIRFVRELVEHQKCSQLFMISHYAEGFAAFVNADICVMDSTNILTIPGSYNKHVKIA